MHDQDQYRYDIVVIGPGEDESYASYGLLRDREWAEKVFGYAQKQLREGERLELRERFPSSSSWETIATSQMGEVDPS